MPRSSFNIKDSYPEASQDLLDKINNWNLQSEYIEFSVDDIRKQFYKEYKMNEKTKEALITLAKSVGVALLAFVTTILTNMAL